jgi:hypothetical protein
MWLCQYKKKEFKVKKNNFTDKYLYRIFMYKVPFGTKDNIPKDNLINDWSEKDKEVRFLIEKIQKEKDPSKVFDLNNKLFDTLRELNCIIKEYHEFNNKS